MSWQAFQYRRLIGFGLLLLAGFGLLEWRLYQLQVVRYAELAGKARPYYHIRRDAPPLRGEIRDCLGRPIVMIRPVKNIFIDPCLLGDRTNQMARVLAPWLRTEAARLVATPLRPRLLGHDRYGTALYDNKVRLKLGASLEEWEGLRRAIEQDSFGFDLARLSRRDKVHLQRLRRHAVYAEDDQARSYPQGNLICQLLGFLDHDPEARTFVAQSGIEKRWDTALAGTAGYCESDRDARGLEIPSRRIAYRPPEDGLNVVLTIDSTVQAMAARELKAGMEKYGAQAAVAIVVRVRTGELLAMASLPDYEMGEGTAVATNAWRNRAVQDVIEPGSTFKIVTYAAALNEGLIGWDKLVDCQDTRDIPGRLTDHERLGVVPYLVAFAKSSNNAAAQLGLALESDRLGRYIRAFGFDEPTGLGVVGERFHSNAPPARGWSRTVLSRAAIGYGVAVSPLQLAMAMSALANHGRLMRPMLIDQLVDNQGRAISTMAPHCVRSVVTPATAALMVTGLKAVVSDDGTGALAQLDGITAAGKTGTARMAAKQGYAKGKYRSTFTGFFPADNPELCVLVMFDEPGDSYYAGQTAAPVFRAIAQQAAAYFHIPSDHEATVAAGK